MRPEKDTIRRILPPLSVLAALAAVFVQYRLLPARDLAREEVLAAGADAAKVDRFLARYGSSAEDRWVAAEAYFRLEEVGKGVRAVLDDPDLARRPDTPRRLAETAFHALGWRAEGYGQPTFLAPLALVSLADGGHEGARSELERRAREEDFAEITTYFYATYLRGARPSRLAIARGLRARPEPRDARLDMAAAVLGLSAGDDAHRETDVAVLAANVGGSVRRDTHLHWASIVIALGRSEHPKAVEALRAAADALAGSDLPMDRVDRAILNTGLLAAGAWDAEPVILPFVDTDQPDPLVVGLYGEAVVHRFHRGEPLGLDRVRRLWSGPSQPSEPELRTRLATALWLRDEVPAAGAPGLEDLLRDLAAPDASDAEKMVAVACRLRQGDPDARAALIDRLSALTAKDSLLVQNPRGGLRAHAAHPSMVGFRALYLLPAHEPDSGTH